MTQQATCAHSGLLRCAPDSEGGSSSCAAADLSHGKSPSRPVAVGASEWSHFWCSAAIWLWFRQGPAKSFRGGGFFFASSGEVGPGGARASLALYSCQCVSCRTVTHTDRASPPEKTNAFSDRVLACQVTRTGLTAVHARDRAILQRCLSPALAPGLLVESSNPSCATCD